MPKVRLPKNGLLRNASLFGVCLFGGLIGGAITRNFGKADYTISYSEFISIMLTAISTLMAVLAIFLAVFGFIGWATISDRVHEKTKDFLNDGFKEGGVLHKMLTEKATNIMYQGVGSIDTSSDVDEINDIADVK